MIEMVYSGKDPEEQGDVRIPKNIHQIGTNESHKKVYIEDYVMTYLKKKPEKEDSIKYGVLLGEVKKGKGNVYIFVKGMVEVKDIIENSLIFNDDIWSGIYKDMKQYFDKLNIVGWFVSVPYRVSDDMNGIKKIHLDNFAGNDKVCFLSDRTEKEEGFYFYEQGSLEKQQGYYIYYEKNEKMKKYVKNSNSNKTNQNQEAQNNTKNQKASVKEQKNSTMVPAKNKDTEQKSFRELLKNGEGAPGRQGRVAYGISGLLIVALLLSTVVMLNNYGELKNIKQTLTSLNRNQEAQAVNEILGSYSQTTAADQNVTTKEPETQIQTLEKVTEKPTETSKSVSSSYSGKYHTVTAGQTLYDISMKYYGTSKMVDQIKEANDIDDDYTIVEGQKILLP
ncbi:MAG: LysM peptidoglycan-binding domain-containing protein [Eubacterium sp.]